jgi:hypothetical protein
MRMLSGALAFACAVVAAYLRFVRPRVLNWNATPEETGRRMPGDEILNGPVLQTTRAITIDAQPRDIWPWLVQIGPRPRAGIYTYDWIERLLRIDIENSDRIMPEFQHLDAGDWIGRNEKGQGIQVREVVPESHLVTQWVPQRSTWTFALYPQADGTTRFISRNRLPATGPLFWLAMVGFMEPASLLMERKMLLGFKERAERHAREHDRAPTVGSEVGPA